MKIWMLHLLLSAAMPPQAAQPVAPIIPPAPSNGPSGDQPCDVHIIPSHDVDYHSRLGRVPGQSGLDGRVNQLIMKNQGFGSPKEEDYRPYNIKLLGQYLDDESQFKAIMESGVPGLLQNIVQPLVLEKWDADIKQIIASSRHTCTYLLRPMAINSEYGVYDQNIHGRYKVGGSITYFFQTELYRDKNPKFAFRYTLDNTYGLSHFPIKSQADLALAPDELRASFARFMLDYRTKLEKPYAKSLRKPKEPF